MTTNDIDTLCDLFLLSSPVSSCAFCAEIRKSESLFSAYKLHWVQGWSRQRQQRNIAKQAMHTLVHRICKSKAEVIEKWSWFEYRIAEWAATGELDLWTCSFVMIFMDMWRRWCISHSPRPQTTIAMSHLFISTKTNATDLEDVSKMQFSRVYSFAVLRCGCLHEKLRSRKFLHFQR